MNPIACILMTAGGTEGALIGLVGGGGTEWGEENGPSLGSAMDGFWLPAHPVVSHCPAAGPPLPTLSSFLNDRNLFLLPHIIKTTFASHSFS